MAKHAELIDVATAAADLGVSVRRVQQLIASGRLPAQTLGGAYVLQRADLEKVRVRKPGRPTSEGPKAARRKKAKRR